MRKIHPLKTRVLWILVLNVILILIPLSGFYFIYLGNYQALQQRTMNLHNCNRSITQIVRYVTSEKAMQAVPVLAPYQRMIIIAPGQRADSGWQSNPDFERRDPFFAWLAGAFLKEITPPDLEGEDIVTRLSKYLDRHGGKTGIINYRFMYSVLPFSRDDSIKGASILLFDKSDIMRTNTLNKIMLAFISVVSGAIALLISVVYYRLFIRPLRSLTREARALRDHHGTSLDIFPMRNRKDEIGQLSLAFYQSTKELIRKKNAVESFTGDVLHELKNPLSAIRNAVELLERINDVKGNIETREILGIISREAGRIDQLLYDIKELSAHENQPPDAESCRPEEVLREAAALYRDRGVRLVIHAKKNHTIPLSREKLGCIVKNLVDNAVDFSPASGSVTVAYVQSEHSATLTVSDLGRGIPEDEKRRVFDRFYSNRSGAEAAGLHSGLGLAIVANILHDRHHSLACYDNEPSGCRFEITFRETV